MEIHNITPETLLEKLNELCAALLDKQDYACSSMAEKFKLDLEAYFEVKRVESI